MTEDGGSFPIDPMGTPARKAFIKQAKLAAEATVPTTPLAGVESVAPTPPAELPRNEIDPNDPDDLTPQQREYLEFFMDPSKTGTKKDWARAHGVNDGTPRRWESLPKFKEALDRRLRELNITPMRTQAVLDNLFALAQGDGTAAVAASKLLLDHIGKLHPIKPVVEDNDVASMSDDELNAALDRLRR